MIATDEIRVGRIASVTGNRMKYEAPIASELSKAPNESLFCVDFNHILNARLFLSGFRVESFKPLVIKAIGTIDSKRSLEETVRLM